MNAQEEELKLKVHVVNLISDLIRKRQTSQAEIARCSTVKQSHISQILRGDTNITLKTLVRICAAMGYRVNISVSEDTSSNS